MDEEGGEDETRHEEKGKNRSIPQIQRSSPDHKTNRTNSYIEPSKLLAKYNPGVSITETDFTKCKEGNRGEDNEGGLSVEDLEGGFISEV